VSVGKSARSLLIRVVLVNYLAGQELLQEYPRYRLEVLVVVFNPRRSGDTILQEL
jgi:metal-responsive CopG/Arc/MetJ family transcriptional regulator